MTDPAANIASACASVIPQGGEYRLDAMQRTALYTDVPRKRGNIYLEHSVQGKPPLRKFPHELLIDGRERAQPCNDWLLPILPDEQRATQLDQRPIAIVDPRAGHGPGIGGGKPDSQVGAALKRGEA